MPIADHTACSKSVKNEDRLSGAVWELNLLRCDIDTTTYMIVGRMLCMQQSDTFVAAAAAAFDAPSRRWRCSAAAAMSRDTHSADEDYRPSVLSIVLHRSRRNLTSFVPVVGPIAMPSTRLSMLTRPTPFPLCCSVPIYYHCPSLVMVQHGVLIHYLVFKIVLTEHNVNHRSEN